MFHSVGFGGFRPDTCARVLVNVVIDLAENDDLHHAVYFVNNNSDTTQIVLNAFQNAIQNMSDPQLRSEVTDVEDEPAVFDSNAFYRHGAYRNQPRVTSESHDSPALLGGDSNLDQMKSSEQVQYGSTSSARISDIKMDESWFDQRMRDKDSCHGYQAEESCLTEVQSSNYSFSNTSSNNFGNVDISNSGMQKEPESSKYDSFEIGGECSRCGNSANKLKLLPCQHRICETCANTGSTLACSFCDVANVITGNQPIGKMDIQVRSDLSLPGFEGLGVVVIHYDFPHGVQQVR